ncbi:hydroxychlorobactene glucosyltransferase CruC [Ignavibacteriales bacterium]
MSAEYILFGVITGFAMITFCVSFYNFLTAPIPGKNLKNAIPGKKLPFISILIPARNEAENIAACVNSCLQQEHTDIELIVLDDHSEDDTSSIVTELATKDSRVKLVRGAALPEGWLGKNWACHQLSLAAKGDYLLFVDADVILRSDAVGIALASVKELNLSMFSVFPTQILNNIGSALVIPVMNWLLLNFLPLRQVYQSKSPSLVAANGQFILMTRKSYEETGGHSSVRSRVVEDMELARLVKRSGQKMMTALGGDVIKCKMYSNLTSSIKGFTKNFYPGFEISAITFVMMTTFFIFVYLLPFFLVIFNPIWLFPILLIIISRIFIGILGKAKLSIEIFAHPIQMIIMYFTGWRSLYFTKTGIIEWKGRTL